MLINWESLVFDVVNSTDVATLHLTLSFIENDNDGVSKDVFLKSSR